MPTRPNSQALKIIFTIISGHERCQTVFPVFFDAALTAQSATDASVTVVGSGYVSAYADCLAADSYISEIQIEAMQPGITVPVYGTFSPGQFPGTILGQSCPPQSSVLLAYYSHEQTAFPDDVTSVAKNFIGPPPESVSSSGDLTDAYCSGVVKTFAEKWLNDSFVLAGGQNGTRGMTSQGVIGALDYIADVVQVRQTSFTQRRRERPYL